MPKNEITQKFEHWCAPICDTSYGNTHPIDVMDYLEGTNAVEFAGLEEPLKPEAPIAPVPVHAAYKKKLKQYEAAYKKYDSTLSKYKKLKSTILVDIVLPLVEKGFQPFNEYGLSASYKTQNGKWEYKTEEFQRLRRILFGQSPEPPEPIPPKTIMVTKEPLIP